LPLPGKNTRSRGLLAEMRRRYNSRRRQERRVRRSSVLEIERGEREGGRILCGNLLSQLFTIEASGVGIVFMGIFYGATTRGKKKGGSRNQVYKGKARVIRKRGVGGADATKDYEGQLSPDCLLSSAPRRKKGEGEMRHGKWEGKARKKWGHSRPRRKPRYTPSVKPKKRGRENGGHFGSEVEFHREGTSQKKGIKRQEVRKSQKRAYRGQL